MNIRALTILLLTLLTGMVTAQPVDMAMRAEELKNLKWGMFICWSFSTFSGVEWTLGVTDIDLFSATDCDTDQWARTAKEAGMGYILFLAKHHDGFCLWDTQTTERKVTNAPLGRDVLAELKQSCDKYGIKLALYFSEGEFGDNWTYHPGGYTPEMKKAQLKELLTQYGPIEYIWFDHAQGTGGVNHAETVNWCHQWQPGTLIGFNHGDPAGEVSLREMGRPGPLGDPIASPYNWQNEIQYPGFLLAEFTYPILPDHVGGAAWFYSLPIHDNLCHPAEKLYSDYLGAAEYGNIFSIDVGPDYNGRLRDIDVATLRQVGQMITNLVSNPGFESGTPSTAYPAGSTDMPSWTVDTTPSDGVQLYPASIIGATQPGNTLVLQLTGGSTYADGGGVQQTLATTSGVTYTVSIDVASRQGNSVTGNFSFGGQNQSISASSKTFTNLTWTVVASSNSTLIDITGSTSPGSGQLLIDNVRVRVTTLSMVASAANSTVAAAPAAVPANGLSPSTITVTLLDSGRVPVAGKTVTLAHTAGPGIPTITTLSGITNDAGVATFTVASSTVGEAVFTATDITDDNLAITETATVTFAALPPITWGTGTTIAGDTDVSTTGTFKYAYNWAGANQTVNGVTFTGTTSFTGGGSDVGLSGFTEHTTANIGTAPPFTALSSAYQAMLAGSPAIYTGNVVNATVTLNNLTIGNHYSVQIWSQDARGSGGYLLSATLSSVGGNSVTLDYNSTDANGGVGQYSIGTFTASATTQTFTTSSLYPLLNALQVRDLTAGGSPYDAWANGTFVPALNDKLPTDNQDGDTLSNLQEYAFGTQPTVSSGEIAYVLNGSVTPGAPKTFTDGTSYSMVFGRRADFVTAGLTYTVQFSTALEAWVDNNDASNPPVQVATDGTINAMTVPYPDLITTPSGPRQPTFSRVKVVLTP